jgi:adenosylmethionine-8-amino-7-oxononanoate aminotransferase
VNTCCCTSDGGHSIKATAQPQAADAVHFLQPFTDQGLAKERMVRRYRDRLGQPPRQTIISRHNAYDGSRMAGASSGGMSRMQADVRRSGCMR